MRNRRRIIAIRVLYSSDCILAQVLKGNHGLKNILGPNFWQNENSEEDGTEARKVRGKDH